MNEQNLKPFNTWSADDHRAASVKGGIASGLSRRRTTAIRELSAYAIAKYQAEQALAKLRKNEQRRQKRRIKRTADPDG